MSNKIIKPERCLYFDMLQLESCLELADIAVDKKIVEIFSDFYQVKLKLSLYMSEKESVIVYCHSH